jgi:hypothetical protein
MTEITALQARQQEVAQYEANIAMYKTIILTLPNEWPDHLLQYRVVENKHKASAEITDLDDVTLVSQLWYADECAAAIRAETVEMTKAKSILAVLEAQA